MNRLKEHKGISLLLRYKKEMLRRMDCLLDLDYHYMVLRRDYGNRFVITEFLQKALSIVVVSFNRFIKDACTISALTVAACDLSSSACRAAALFFSSACSAS